MDFVKKFKKSFTLLEVLIVCGFFSIVILAIIWAITRAYDFMNNNRIQVRAVNFAREWVEMMFNIRDTNWRKNSWEKDKNWRNLWTWDGKFGSGIYVLKEWKNSDDDMYIYASGLNVNDVDNFYSDDFWDDSNSNYRESAKIIFTWTYNYLSWEYVDETEEWQFKLETWNVAELLWGGSEFYRIVRVYDVVDKLDDCEDGDACPKEMRFCVKVFYRNNKVKRSTELCSIMTNFEE